MIAKSNIKLRYIEREVQGNGKSHHLAFSFKLSKNEVAHKLLGSKIKTKLSIPDDGIKKEIEQHGIIAGIGYPFLADHTIHIKFDKPDEVIKKLIYSLGR